MLDYSYFLHAARQPCDTFGHFFEQKIVQSDVTKKNIKFYIDHIFCPITRWFCGHLRKVFIINSKKTKNTVVANSFTNQYLLIVDKKAEVGVTFDFLLDSPLTWLVGSRQEALESMIL